MDEGKTTKLMPGENQEEECHNPGEPGVEHEFMPGEDDPIDEMPE